MSATREQVIAYFEAIKANGHTECRIGTWASPANAYPQWDRRYDTARGYAIRYLDPLGSEETRYVITGEAVRKWTGDAFIVDDGETVKPYYVAAYRLDGAPEGVIECDPYLILCPYRPTDRQTSYLLRSRMSHHVQVDVRFAL